MRICILHNPSAGHATDFRSVQQSLAMRDDLTLVEPTSPEALYEAVAEAAREGYDVIAAAGGDGTVHLVVNALMAIGTSAADRPDLAVLPLGTGNDYARTLAVPLHAGQALALIGRGIRRVMEVIRVECAEEAPCFAINLCSGGFTADMREALTDERKDRWGALAYLMAGAETLPNRTTYRVQLAYDDGPPEARDLHALVVASGRTAGGGQPNAPQANPEDGLLDVVMARAGSLSEVAGLAARAVVHGDVLASGLIESRRARRVQVESDPAMSFVIDGEPKVKTPVTFTAVPDALCVVVGDDYQVEPE